MNKDRQISQHSAGGVVVHETEEGVYFLCIKPAGQQRWQLPKGVVDAGELPVQTAVREVREEGGVDADIIRPLDTIRYFFRSGGRTIAKRVDFFLMRYVAGNILEHDSEVDEAAWVEIDNFERLSFASEQQMVAKAQNQL